MHTVEYKCKPLNTTDRGAALPVLPDVLRFSNAFILKYFLKPNKTYYSKCFNMYILTATIPTGFFLIFGWLGGFYPSRKVLGLNPTCPKPYCPVKFSLVRILEQNAPLHLLLDDLNKRGWRKLWPVLNNNSEYVCSVL